MHFHFGCLEFGVPIPQGRKMPTRSFTWCRRAAFGVLLLFGVLSAPSPAHAQCGDHVSFGSASDQERGNRPVPNEAVPAKPDQNAPCHGPFCQSRENPKPAPPTTASLHVRDCPCVLEIAILFEANATALAFLDEVHFPMKRSFLIYHPPRPISF